MIMTAAPSPFWRALSIFVLWSAVSAPALASDDYLARRDGITLSEGNAVAHNKAIQTIDPWPAHAGRTRMQADGERMLLSIDRYQKNESLEPAGLKGSGASEDSAAPAPAAE